MWAEEEHTRGFSKINALLVPDDLRQHIRPDRTRRYRVDANIFTLSHQLEGGSLRHAYGAGEHSQGKYFANKPTPHVCLGGFPGAG